MFFLKSSHFPTIIICKMSAMQDVSTETLRVMEKSWNIVLQNLHGNRTLSALSKDWVILLN